MIAKYGHDLTNVLANWPQSDPIYYYKGQHFFIVPAASASQAGSNKLWVSQELLPPDLTAGDTPSLPENFQYLLAVYAALTFLDEDDPLWAKRNKEWAEGTVAMLETMFPRARQAEIVAHIPNDSGSDY